MKNAEVDAKFTDIMIGTAARDLRIHEVSTLLLFRSGCPEGRIYESELTADVASDYALGPEEMHEVFAEYERQIREVQA